MSYTILPADYVEMDKFFQSRADSIKSAMLTAVPWMLTVVAGFISYRIKEGILGGASNAAKPETAITLGIVSLLISTVALLVTREFCNHIKLNWARSKKAIELLRETTSTITRAGHPYVELTELESSGGIDNTWILNMIYGLVIFHMLVAVVLILYPMST